MTLTTDPVPPETVEHLWCPVCERILADVFRQRPHHMPNGRCRGTPILLTYRLEQQTVIADPRDSVSSAHTTRKEPRP